MIPILVIRSPKQNIIVRIIDDQPKRTNSGCNIFFIEKYNPTISDTADTNKPV